METESPDAPAEALPMPGHNAIVTGMVASAELTPTQEVIAAFEDDADGLAAVVALVHSGQPVQELAPLVQETAYEVGPIAGLPGVDWAAVATHFQDARFKPAPVKRTGPTPAQLEALAMQQNAPTKRQRKPRKQAVEAEESEEREQDDGPVIQEGRSMVTNGALPKACADCDYMIVPGEVYQVLERDSIVGKVALCADKQACAKRVHQRNSAVAATAEPTAVKVVFKTAIKLGEMADSIVTVPKDRCIEGPYGVELTLFRRTMDGREVANRPPMRVLVPWANLSHLERL